MFYSKNLLRKSQLVTKIIGFYSPSYFVLSFSWNCKYAAVKTKSLLYIWKLTETERGSHFTFIIFFVRIEIKRFFFIHLNRIYLWNSAFSIWKYRVNIRYMYSNIWRHLKMYAILKLNLNLYQGFSNWRDVKRSQYLETILQSWYFITQAIRLRQKFFEIT